MCADGKLWLNDIDTLEEARDEKHTADNECTGCNLAMPRRHRVLNQSTLAPDSRNLEHTRDVVARRQAQRKRKNTGKYRCSACGEPGHTRRVCPKTLPRVTAVP